MAKDDVKRSDNRSSEQVSQASRVSTARLAQCKRAFYQASMGATRELQSEGSQFFSGAASLGESESPELAAPEEAAPLLSHGVDLINSEGASVRCLPVSVPTWVTMVKRRLGGYLSELDFMLSRPSGFILRQLDKEGRLSPAMKVKYTARQASANHGRVTLLLGRVEGLVSRLNLAQKDGVLGWNGIQSFNG